MIKPYVGFGAGATVVKWEAYYVELHRRPYTLYDVKIDSGTEVKLTFGIPFGCEFQIAPNLSLGPRAEYLIITGEADGINPYEDNERFEATVPNIFLFGGAARFEF